jgi:hypothetical protein
MNALLGMSFYSKPSGIEGLRSVCWYAIAIVNEGLPWCSGGRDCSTAVGFSVLHSAGGTQEGEVARENERGSWVPSI